MHMLACYFYRKPNEVQISASLNAMKFQKHTSLPHPIRYRMPKFSCYAGYKLAERILRKLPLWMLEIFFVVVFSNRFHPRHFEKAFWSHGVRRSKRIFFLCVVAGKNLQGTFKRRQNTIKATAFKTIKSLMILILNYV